MQCRVAVPQPFGELRKPRKQHPNAHVHMNKKGSSPHVDVDVVLLDPQEANVGVVWNVREGDPRHQKHEECERRNQQRVYDKTAIDIFFGLG